MKYFFPALMGLLILAGVSLVATPYIAEYFFPAKTMSLRTATSEDVRNALANWFGTSPDAVSDAKGVNQMSSEGNASWFAFTMERQLVENFIRKNRLEQKELDSATLQRVFTVNEPPAEWWQPQSLARQTCFIGMEEGHSLGLIYNAEQQRGFLVVKTVKKTSGF